MRLCCQSRGLEALAFTQGGGKYWFFFVVLMLLCQVLTLPLAATINFKSAYLFTFIIGYYYTMRFGEEQREDERKVWSVTIVVLSILGYFLRTILNNVELTGMAERFGAMAVQYIKMIWACAIFVLMSWLMPSKWWEDKSDSIKNCLTVLAAYTYEAYLVHEFFLHVEFRSLIPGGVWAEFLVAMAMIPLSAWLLHRLAK